MLKKYHRKPSEILQKFSFVFNFRSPEIIKCQRYLKLKQFRDEDQLERETSDDAASGVDPGDGPRVETDLISAAAEINFCRGRN